MGQKVSPIGMRVGVIRDWQSRWYADDKEFGTLLMEDVKIRELVEAYYAKLSNEAVDKRKADPQISRIEIERTKGRMTVIIRTAHPGVVIGQDGKSIEGLKKKVAKIASAKNVQINVVEVANPNLDARLVARWIANELEGRKSFRATQKKAIQNTMRAGAKGIKTAVSGRLGGADMARTEGYSEGVVPLHTLRSDIDYAWEEAATQYGRLGVKVGSAVVKYYLVKWLKNQKLQNNAQCVKEKDVVVQMLVQTVPLKMLLKLQHLQKKEVTNNVNA